MIPGQRRKIRWCFGVDFLKLQSLIMCRLIVVSYVLPTLLLVIWGCGKNDPTIIEGRITDQKTGKALEGAYTVFYVQQLDGSGSTGQSSMRSNANGEFICTLDSDYDGSEETHREGYITKFTHSNFVNGQTNRMQVQLVPRDGVLILKINNNVSQHDTIYVYLYSRIESIENGTNGSAIELKVSPVVLQMGETYTEIFDLASPEEIQITWG